MPAMDQAVLAEIKRLEAAGDIENPRYMELLIPHHYVQHVLRMPPAQWPDPVNRALQAPQPGDLRPDAGAERARRERQARQLGSHGRSRRRSPCRRWSSARATTRWTRRTWRWMAAPCSRAATSTARTAATWRCRRPEDLLRRPDRVPARRRRRALLIATPRRAPCGTPPRLALPSRP